MKYLCGLGKCERILIVGILVCLLVLVATSVRLETYKKIDSVHKERIRVSELRLAKYEIQVQRLGNIIVILQKENEELQNQKREVLYQTIVEVDSVRALPFNGKSDFFTSQVSRIDSIRERYLSWTE